MGIKIEITDLNYIDKNHLKALGEMFISISNTQVEQPKDKDCPEIKMDYDTVYPVEQKIEIVNNSSYPVQVAPPIASLDVPSPPTMGEEFTFRVPPIANTSEFTISINPDSFNPAIAHPAGAELDSAGLPWDMRIHSREKTKVKDGTWKIKRGVDANVVTQVTSQLKNVMHIPSPPAPAVHIPPPPPISVTGPTSVREDNLPLLGAESRLPMANTVTTFPEMIDRVMELVDSGKMQSHRVHELARTLGFERVNLLSVRPDLIPQMMALIDAEVESK